MAAQADPKITYLSDASAPTRLRYCINSVSLQFVKAGDPLPDPLHRGDKIG